MGEEENYHTTRKTNLHLIFLFTVFAGGGVLFGLRLVLTSSLPLYRSLGNQEFVIESKNNFSCDRSDYHSDICFMQGDVRTHPSSSSILLYSSTQVPEQKIRPYTRKWEGIIMDKVEELHLKISSETHDSSCDVRHDVPALFFSAGGYTGNIFHAFSNLIVPLYITSQHLNRRVVFVVLHYRRWWYTKYREILSQLSDYPPIDFFNDTRTHCFPAAIVGLRFHGTISVDPARMKDNKTIVDFHRMLDEAYKPQTKDEEGNPKLKLVIVARGGTRAIENEEEVVGVGRDAGFDVEVLRPGNTVAMATIYRSLSGCDVMMGVHGAALTHFLFMRPGSVFLQIVPLGVEELARICFGEAAVKMGLRYEEYRVLPRESSLYRKYGEGDPVVEEPEKVKAKGWEVTKEVYLEGQNVTLDVNRLRERLVQAFQYAILKSRYQI